MENCLDTAIWAVNKWMFFGWNIPHRTHIWIDAWGEKCSQYLPTFIVEVDWNAHFDHMVEKWNDAVRDSGDSALARFYAELGNENRRALICWVMANYNNEIKL